LLSKVPAYKADFEKVYGPGPITIDKLVKSIAAFERTLVTPNSPYDKYVAGDAKAIDASAQRGMKLVETVGCTSCHNGPMFSGPTLPMGTGFYQKFPVFADTPAAKKYKFADDLGRFSETKVESDKHLFRVPTWRNIGITAPYFSNGAVATLDEAVKVMAKVQLNKDLPAKDVKDIVAFLKTLTGERPKVVPPTLPPSEESGNRK